MEPKVKHVVLVVQLALLGLVCFGIALVFGTLNSHMAGNARAGCASGGEHFVFADLDGDRQPDMALVEMQSQRFANANYSIRVRLSAGEEWAIGVNGPAGGLRLVARDVNGDDTIDLVVTSNVDGSFIEVLLNDGHGNFRVATPDEFPRLEGVADVALHAPGAWQIDQSSIESVRSAFDMKIAPADEFDTVFSSGSRPPSVLGAALQGTSALRLSRSPPVPVLS
jgi:hypothetical protein